MVVLGRAPPVRGRDPLTVEAVVARVVAVVVALVVDATAAVVGVASVARRVVGLSLVPVALTACAMAVACAVVGAVAAAVVASGAVGDVLSPAAQEVVPCGFAASAIADTCPTWHLPRGKARGLRRSAECDLESWRQCTPVFQPPQQREWADRPSLGQQPERV